MARLADLTGQLNRYNRSPSPAEADALAMWADWSAVGADVAHAANQFNGKTRVELARVEKQ
ncbi:MAG: hypothetical protein K2V38_22580 [Gemmataceae bacterium]|nr:hypothetical protein [Gemmataceae bacterium]